MMKKISLAVLLLAPIATNAEVLSLDDALRATYTACIGIDDDLAELRKMAGINTAITAVGTGLGIGAVSVGAAKANVDAEIRQKMDQLLSIANTYQGPDPTPEEKAEWFAKFEATYTVQSSSQEAKETQDEIDQLTQKSKKLGNWRTGLLATNTATNVAGAVIADKNRSNDELQEKINNCIAATQNLNDAILAARMNGEDITEAKQIYESCKDYKYVDITPINKRATGAMISSIVGAGVGFAGTVTSGVANSDKIRNDNTMAGETKEAKLNTAANVLAAGATMASATATVFNATQISAIKKVSEVSEKCTGVLK